jgi:hypothetical protein
MRIPVTWRESALTDFRAAVHALSNDPSSENVARYLLASRALEQSHTGVAPKRGMPARETGGRQAAA